MVDINEQLCDLVDVLQGRYLVFFSASISSLTQRIISSCAVHCRSACLTPASLSSSSFSTSWDDRKATRCSPCSDCRSTSSTCLRSTSVQSPCSSFPVDFSFKACKAYESKSVNAIVIQLELLQPASQDISM